MRKFKPGRPSPAMVVAMVALFVAMSGSGIAAVTLSKNSVGASQIKTNAVGASEIKKGAVRSSEVKDGTLGLAEFKAADRASLKGDKGDKGDTGPSTGPAGGALTGTYPNPGLADNTVTSSKVSDGSLGAADAATIVGTFTDDPPSQAANSCTDRAPSNGAAALTRTTDHLLVTMPPTATDLQMVVFAANSIENGFVRIQYCNPTGSAIDMPSQTYKLMIFR